MEQDRSTRARVYKLISNPLRSGLVWIMAKCVLYEYLNYSRPSVARLLGLEISPYRPTASCITDDAFMKALNKNGLETTMKAFSKFKVVLSRPALDTILFKSLDLQIKPEDSDVTYLLTYNKKKEKKAPK